MSDFFVKTIVDELAEAGFPLSAQQIDALSTSRKKAVAKAREEIKNAVRASLLANGLNFNEIKIAARAMTQETVNNTLKERKLDSLINQGSNTELGSCSRQPQTFARKLSQRSSAKPPRGRAGAGGGAGGGGARAARRATAHK